MIVYSYTKNSLLQAIIHRTKEGRILMEKIQENVTRKTDIPQAVITEAENDFIMLPIVDFCFKELMQNETDLMKWMRFLGGKKREDFKKMAEKNPEMKEAYDMLDRMSADEKARLEYEARQKLIRDRNMILKTAQHRFEKGLQEGREAGLREGRETGLREGRETGLREGRAEGRAEERNRINQLNVKLAELQRTEDILKAATDEEYQKKLLKEFGLES